MALIGTHAPGATPLRPEEIAALRPAVSWITTHEQLNQAEAANIAEYEAWMQSARGVALKRVLTDDFLIRLHKRMFGNVWRWAGQYRLHDLQNEFASPHTRIRQDMRVLFEDITFLATTALEPVSPQELAARLHHRIVRVHPFPNGNGRTSRAIADFLLEKVFRVERFRWGSADLATIGEMRSEYIAGLEEADRGDYERLMRFCI